MFTGIVQGKATVKKLREHGDNGQFRSLTLQFPDQALVGLTQGASIAINGVCLTVTEFNVSESTAQFDVIKETLEKSNLGELMTSSKVNYERAAKIGDEIGGHLMSGHVLTCVELKRIEKSDHNITMFLNNAPEFAPYLLTKGFVGLNGCSLTLGEVCEEYFCVHLIPETLAMTTFGNLEVGARLNLEIDPQTQTIVDTVSRIMAKN